VTEELLEHQVWTDLPDTKENPESQDHPEDEDQSVIQDLPV